MEALTFQTSPLLLIPKCKCLRELKQIQGFSIKTHLQYDITVLSNLIKSSCGLNPTTPSVHHAHQLFDQIPQPDIILLNTLARAYARSHTPLRAVVLFADSVSSAEPLRADRYTLPALLKVCVIARALGEGRQLHSLAVKQGHGIVLDAYAIPAMITMYAVCGLVDAARRIFDNAVADVPCIIAYNAIIAGYTKNGMPNEALSLFRDLAGGLVEPTEVTMLSVISCCSMLGALKLGRWAHEYVKRRGFDRFVKVNTALIDMYAKCGSLEDAEAVFSTMLAKDTPAWSAMIAARAIHGRAFDAFEAFDEMKRRKFKPDEVTFLGLLSACAHTGMVGRGFEFLREMSEEHGISPTIRHFGCMVDLLGKSGRLIEAYNFVESLPIRPTPILWRTILAACCSHRNFELGKRAMERILALDDTHGGDYVIFSNLCAKSGRPDEVDSMRKTMRDRGVVKIPGCSAIEVDNVVHEFFAGDGERRVSGELSRYLHDLMEELKRVGYVADVSMVTHHEMSDEEKEMSLRYHSEKLAIAYGLLNTSQGTTIRVVKNLRVCGDCHSMAKLVSLVSKRVIVLRDVHRFHHFKEGLCSCGDYW